MGHIIINSKNKNNFHKDILDNTDYHRNIINLLKSNFHFPISGGSGKSMNDPITIELTKENDYVGIEYEIIKCLGILNGFKWEVIEQRLNFRDGKKIDQLKIEIIQNNTGQKIIMDYYFDITECFDKFKSDVSDYLRNKQNTPSKQQ